MNKVLLTGRLTKDIEIKNTGSMQIGKFTVAADRGKDKEGKDKGTDFINCVVFGKSAEVIAKYSGKGKRILVEGRIQTGSYEDKEGKKHYTTDVIADRTEIIDFKDDKPAAAEKGSGPNYGNDIPF